MTPKKFSVSKGVTVNIGNYESIRIDASTEFELSEKDKDVKKCVAQGYEFLDEQINKQLADVQSILHPKSAFKTA